MSDKNKFNPLRGQIEPGKPPKSNRPTIRSVKTSPTSGGETDVARLIFECDNEVKQDALDHISEILISTTSAFTYRLLLLKKNVTVDTFIKDESNNGTFYCEFREKYKEDINTWLTDTEDETITVSIIYNSTYRFSGSDCKITCNIADTFSPLSAITPTE